MKYLYLFVYFKYYNMLLYSQLIFLLFIFKYQFICSLTINNECTNCKHFSKTIYLKTVNQIIKPLPLSIGYCKLALDINTEPTIKLYKTVEYFRSNVDKDNCGPDGKFYKKL